MKPMVAIVGRPNVGKSTLMNAILGQKIAIVSNKPQTTRRRQLGIYTTEQAQLIFVDTPGVNRPRRKLDEYMRREAIAALDDVDITALVIHFDLDVGVEPHLLLGRRLQTRDE